MALQRNLVSHEGRRMHQLNLERTPSNKLTPHSLPYDHSMKQSLPTASNIKPTTPHDELVLTRP